MVHIVGNIFGKDLCVRHFDMDIPNSVYLRISGIRNSIITNIICGNNLIYYDLQ